MPEGFRPSGLQIRNQRNKLRILTLVKFMFGDFGKIVFRTLKLSKLITIGSFRLWEHEKTTYHAENLLGAYIKAYFEWKMTYLWQPKPNIVFFTT